MPSRFLSVLCGKAFLLNCFTASLALADMQPPPPMLPDASNALLPTARDNLGIGAAIPVGVLYSAAGAPAAAGTGYVPGETVTLTGGVATSPGKLAITDTKAVSGTVAGGGTGGSNGACTVTGTTGTGTKAQFTGTVSGGALTGPLTVAVAGDYTVNPTAIAAEPVTGCSLSGAQVNMTMGALVYAVQNPGVYSSVPANPVAQGSTSGSGSGATFTLSYGPIAAAPSFSTLTPGGGNAVWGFYGTGRPNLTTGRENTFGGYESGGNISTGNFNSAYGHNSLGIGGGCSNQPGSSNSAFGTDAMRNYCGTGGGGGGNSAFGAGALQNNASTTGGLQSAFGSGSMINFNPASANKFYNAAFGYQSCKGASGGNFDLGTCLGSNTGAALTSASKFAMIGQGTGNTTCASGSDFLLIDSGNNSVDCPAAASSNFLNVSKVIAGDTAGAANPMVCAVGMKCAIGVLRGANFNVTTDQSITIRPLTSGNTGQVSAATKYFITDIYVTNCSASLTTAKGGFYTSAGKTGTIVGATTTPFTNCTSTTTAQRLTGLANQDTTLFSAATLFLSLTTAQGGAATGDVYVIGELVN